VTTTSPTRPLVQRRTTPVAAFPAWAMGGLFAAAILLAASALVSDGLLLMGITLLVLGIAASVVFYRPHIGVLVIMSTMLVSYPEALKGFGPITINNLLGATLIAILAFQVYRSHDYWFLREPELRMLLLIGTLLVLTFILSKLFLPDIKHMLPKLAKARGVQGFYGTIEYSNRWFFELGSRLAFVIFFVNWVKTPKQMRTILLVFALCIIAVIPSIGMDIAKGTSEYRISSKLVGWASNANRFAFMVNVGIALFVYLAHVVRSPGWKAMCLLGAAGCVPLVLMSASRSGFLGMGLVGFLILFSDQIPRRWKFTSAIVGVVVAVVVFGAVLSPEAQERLLNLNPFATQPHIEGSRSTETRVATLGEALSMISEYPIFGVGLGNFRWMNMYMHRSYKPPHNSYVWSWAEGGVFTTIAYLTLFGFLFARIQRLRPKFKDHPVLPHMPEFLNLYLILFFFFSIFADVWLEVHIYFIIAMAIVLSRWALDEELRSRGLPGATANTPGARRAVQRALYSPQRLAAPEAR
jgi:O-antigen ligase